MITAPGTGVLTPAAGCAIVRCADASAADERVAAHRRVPHRLRRHVQSRPLDAGLGRRVGRRGDGQADRRSHDRRQRRRRRDRSPHRPSATAPTLLYTRVGRLGSAVQVKLVAEDGRVLDRAELSADVADETAARYVAAAIDRRIGRANRARATRRSTTRLPISEAADGSVASGVVQVADVESLPTDWFGYDSGRRARAHDERRRVLRATCRRRDSASPLCESGSSSAAGWWFAAVAPRRNCSPPGSRSPSSRRARFTELVRLPQTQALENYAGSGDAIGQSGAQQNIPVAAARRRRGRVELFGRGERLADRGAGRPRARRTDVRGVDLTRAAIRRVVRSRRRSCGPCCGRISPTDDANAKQKLVSLGYDDLAGALRQRLGRIVRRRRGDRLSARGGARDWLPAAARAARLFVRRPRARGDRGSPGSRCR